VSNYSDDGSVRCYLTFLTEDFREFTQEIIMHYPEVKENTII